jgi:CheY-like chemotaxis protein
VLDFSKIEAGRLKLEMIDFDLQEQLERTIDLQSSAARKKHLNLILDFDPNTPPQVKGDPVRLRQIILNLVSNAIKFTEKGEVIVHVAPVSSSTNNIRLKFEVQDTGIGIPPEIQQNLFQRFIQADSSTSRKFGGTGLGLAICRRLVELMHGEINVISTPSRGSTFQFFAEFGHAAPVTAQADLSGSIAKRRILVVDDNATNRKVFDHLLKRWQTDSTSVQGAAEAVLELSRTANLQKPYELVLIDHNMADIDGLALARTIQSDPTLGRPVLALLTSQNEKLSPDELAKNGLSACEHKPIPASRLRDLILRVLNKRSTAPIPTKTPTPLIPQKNAKRARILIVEDNLVNQKVTLQYLKQAGHLADLASNGIEALQSIRQNSYELVLMDVHMPVMDGLEATRRIRAAQAAGEPGFTANLQIVAMTANAMTGDREVCLAVGMDGYVSKPLTPSSIHSMLEEHLKTS